MLYTRIRLYNGSRFRMLSTIRSHSNTFEETFVKYVSTVDGGDNGDGDGDEDGDMRMERRSWG